MIVFDRFWPIASLRHRQLWVVDSSHLMNNQENQSSELISLTDLVLSQAFSRALADAILSL